MPDLAQSVLRIAVLAVPFMLGIVCHEVAHGYAALLYGDTTARDAGRLTLNPARHLDPAGTLVFILTAMFAGFAIGWAKPVPINPGRFRDLRAGMVVVSAAGAAANFVLAGLFLAAFAGLKHLPVGGWLPLSLHQPLYSIAMAGVFLNAILGVFNLLPIPPLDGSKILCALLPASLARPYLRLERYGMFILVLVLASGVLRFVLGPVLSVVETLLAIV